MSELSEEEIARAMEREWTDQFGTHYEVIARGADGRLHKQKVTKLAHGWPKERETASEAVRAAGRAALSSDGK